MSLIKQERYHLEIIDHVETDFYAAVIFLVLARHTQLDLSQAREAALAIYKDLEEWRNGDANL